LVSDFLPTAQLFRCRLVYLARNPNPNTYPIMKPRSVIVSGISVLALTAGAALAQEGGRPGGDGARAGEYLKRADSNGDGKVSKEEFVNMSKTEAEERFGRMDGNSDGYVDEKEVASVGDRLREFMRNRGGGAGDRPEGRPEGFRRPPEGERPSGDRPPGERPSGDRPPPPEGGRPGGPPGGPGGPGGPQGPNIDELFGRMDKNSDGSVDKEEYIAFAKEEVEQRFGRMDENADGKLTKEEARNAMERMRGMRGPGGPGGPGAPGGMRRPGGEGEGGGFRRPPGEGGEGRRPPPEGEKKDAA
jgi:Ca2+-binding EF-hand superfamily protein